MSKDTISVNMNVYDIPILVEQLEKANREIERLNTNLEVANEDLTRIAQLLNLEEGCTIHDIEDKIGKYKSIIKEAREYIEMQTPSDIGICGNSTKRYYTLGEDSVDHILEILDKENNKTNEVMPIEELEEYEPKNMAEQEYQDWFWD